MDGNFCMFVGRLAADVKFFPGNGTVSDRAIGTLMVNRIAGRDGKKRADAIPLVAWNDKAKVLADYTSKGKELTIRGEWRTKRRQLDDGKWENFHECLVQYISLGNDSNTQKVMKAVEGGGEVTADLASLVKNLGPEVIAQLEKVAQGAKKETSVVSTEETPSEPAESAKEPPTPDEVVDSPFVSE